MKNLYAEAKISTALDYAEGSADREGASLDMKGFGAAAIIVKFAAIAGSAATTIKAQQSSDAGVADGWSDLEGTSQTIADDDDDQVFIIDLINPTKRYVRLYVDKDAAHNTAETALYMQYQPMVIPVVQTVASEVTYEAHASPAEGTA